MMEEINHDQYLDQPKTRILFEHSGKNYFIDPMPDTKYDWDIIPWRVYITDEIGLALFESRPHQDWIFGAFHDLWNAGHNFSSEDLQNLTSKVNANFGKRNNRFSNQINDTIR